MEGLPPIELSQLRQQIVTDEIVEYSNSNELVQVIQTLKSNSDEAVEQFRDVLVMLTEELARVTGDHMISMHKDTIIGFIAKNPKGLVDSFILKCYETKDGILRKKMVQGEESFFMTNSFNDISDGDSDIVNIIFQFKNFWGKLNTENREIIKNSLLAIVSLCDMRYVSFKKYSCLKKLNPSSPIFSQMDSVF